MLKIGKGIEMRKESVQKLINMYKERPCLWKLNDENYTNKNMKQKEYAEIVDAFREEYPDIDINVIKANCRTSGLAIGKELKKWRHRKEVAKEWMPFMNRDYGTSICYLLQETTENLKKKMNKYEEKRKKRNRFSNHQSLRKSILRR